MSRVHMRAHALARVCAVGFLLVASVACRKSPSTAALDGGTDGGASAASSPPGKPPEGSSPESAWMEARGGDPLELARLANVEGAVKLSEVAANDGASDEDRATAIRALAFVADPSPAAEILGKLVTGPSIERSTLALQTLTAITPRRAQIEELEPGAWRLCADALLVALKTLEGPMRRELAIRALHGLADRGAVTAASIPAQ